MQKTRNQILLYVIFYTSLTIIIVDFKLFSFNDKLIYFSITLAYNTLLSTKHISSRIVKQFTFHKQKMDLKSHLSETQGKRNWIIFLLLFVNRDRDQREPRPVGGY